MSSRDLCEVQRNHVEGCSPQQSSGHQARDGGTNGLSVHDVANACIAAEGRVAFGDDGHRGVNASRHGKHPHNTADGGQETLEGGLALGLLKALGLADGLLHEEVGPHVVEEEDLQ